jgi:hypothetical protein
MNKAQVSLSSVTPDDENRPSFWQAVFEETQTIYNVRNMSHVYCNTPLFIVSEQQAKR